MEELEDVAALVAGGGGLEDHLEAAADLHRAVALLWVGVGDALNSLPGETRLSGDGDGDGDGGGTRQASSGGGFSGELIQAAPQARVEIVPGVASAGGNDTLVAANADALGPATAGLPSAVGEHAIAVSGMLRDQELLDIPMHLEDSPLPIVTTALSVDAGRVQAAAKFLLAGMLGALSAAKAAAAEAASAAAAVAATAAPLQHHREGDKTGDATPPTDCPPTPTVPTPPAPVPLAPVPQAPPLDDETGSPPGSDRQSSAEFLSDEGGEEAVEASSAASGDMGSTLEEEVPAAGEEGGLSICFTAGCCCWCFVCCCSAAAVGAGGGGAATAALWSLFARF